MRHAVRPDASPPPRDQRGFVIIGVVMFVLALTILGLSLFNLSSYEAQFLGRSRRNAQTLYDAMSGVEWAKVVLGRERKLQAVDSTQPAWGTRPQNVVSVEAWQGSNSNGNINFSNGEYVRIRVLADDQRGERRMVEMQYEPVVPDELYRHVIDSYSYVHLIYQDAEGDIRRTTLDGAVRLNTDTYPNWQTEAWPPLPPPPTISGVVMPDVASFFAAHPTVNAPAITGIGEYTLIGTGGVTYFKTDPPGATVSLYDNSDEPGSPPPPVDFIVSGTCVWMFPKGMRVNRPVRVVGTTADRLVIVAGKIEHITGVLPKDPTGFIEGIWLFSGLDSPNVPVVLVSDAQVAINHTQLTTASGTVNALSIFARSVFLDGPETQNSPTPNVQVLRHDVDMDAVIDELAGLGALPNLAVGGSSFDPVAGTWRELDPDNPS